MDNLANFIWIGPRLVNLNQVAHFTIDHDSRVVALICGVAKEDAELVVEGEEATILIGELKRIKRLEAPRKMFPDISKNVIK